MCKSSLSYWALCVQSTCAFVFLSFPKRHINQTHKVFSSVYWKYIFAKCALVCNTYHRFHDPQVAVLGCGACLAVVNWSSRTRTCASSPYLRPGWSGVPRWSVVLTRVSVARLSLLLNSLCSWVFLWRLSPSPFYRPSWTRTCLPRTLPSWAWVKVSTLLEWMVWNLDLDCT